MPFAGRHITRAFRHFLLSPSKKSFPLNGHFGFKRVRSRVISAPCPVTEGSNQQKGSGVKMPLEEAFVWPFCWACLILYHFIQPVPRVPAPSGPAHDERLYDDGCPTPHGLEPGLGRRSRTVTRCLPARA